MSAYRSRISKQGVTLAILPTWSDGALVKLARPELTVEDGEWHFGQAPQPTHSSAAEFLAAFTEA